MPPMASLCQWKEEAFVLCPECNSSNRDDATYCSQCGFLLAPMCPRCGRELQPEAQFCDRCGARWRTLTPETAVGRDSAAAEVLQRLAPTTYVDRLLAAGGKMAGERKMVTILMADVTGSSALSRDLDPEEWLEIMDGAFEVLIEPVARYEGTVARLEGDAILAFFGAPMAHEDDPARACRAGLEILQGARAYAGRLEREQGVSGFDVRVGIHTGLAVVGEVGTDLRMEYTAMGETPNLTARLEAAAKPGTVLISEATHRLVAPLFETEPLEPIQAKGWQQPVPVWRVLAVREVPSKVRGIEGLESPLVGREAEIDTLLRALERLRVGACPEHSVGDGGIVTIVGEAGMGKSRLVAEVRQQGSSKPAEPSQPVDPRWVEGRCLSYGTSIAYLPWLEALRSLMGVGADEAPTAVVGVLKEFVRSVCDERFDDVYPYLAQMLSLPLENGYEQLLVRLDGQELRARTFLAVERAFACSATQRPLVLVLEDLHWADDTSLALLEHLLAAIERVPLLILAVFRPHKEHGSWRFRQAVAEQYAGRHTDLVLDPLTAADGQTLVDNLLRTSDLPQELIGRILARAEGNPFYVEEILRTLLDDGTIVPDRETEGWRVTRNVAEIALPDTLQAVLVARLDRLQVNTKRVLQMASVIGRIFLYRLLQALVGEELGLDAHLLRLQQEEMIRVRARMPELEYIFKHDLTREAAYNGLLRKQRREYHKQVAKALERLFPDRVEEQLGLLAYHWELAGDAEKAVGYLLRAAQRDVRQFANQEAIVHFRRGVALLESMPPAPERVQMEFALQMGLGAPLIATKGYGAPEVGRAWKRARELSQQMGDHPQLWPAQSAIYQYHLVRAEHQTALEIAQHLADAGDRMGEELLFPVPRGELGISCFYLGHLVPARTHLEAMVACYDREKDRSLAFVYGQDVGVLRLSYLAWVLWLLGHVGQSLERSHEAVDLAQALDHPFTQALALSMASWLRASCRDVPEAAKWAKASAEVSRPRRFVFYEAGAVGLQGWALVSQGAAKAGETEIRRGLAAWQAAGCEFHRPHFLTWLAEAAAEMGRSEEALDLLAEALDLVEKTDERYYEAEIRRLRAEFLLELSHAAEAEAGFQQAIEVARQQSARSLELRATVSLARLWQSQGRRKDAENLLAAIYDWFYEGFDTPDLKDAKALLEELA
jgi:class 3 adenylate cyclase/tetratricopeptide (TPR) repeat protein